MSSASANLSYGFAFEEGFRFPWTDDEDNDIEKWWVNNGFVNPVEYPFDDDGDYKEGFTGDDFDTWYDNRQKWLKENPVPIHVVSFGWCEQPHFILAAVNLSSYNDCDPAKLDAESMSITEKDKQRLIDFVQKYNIETTGEPSWHLSAFIY